MAGAYAFCGLHGKVFHCIMHFVSTQTVRFLLLANMVKDTSLCFEMGCVVYSIKNN